MPCALACEQAPGEDEKISASAKQKNSESKAMVRAHWEPVRRLHERLTVSRIFPRKQASFTLPSAVLRSDSKRKKKTKKIEIHLSQHTDFAFLCPLKFSCACFIFFSEWFTKQIDDMLDYTIPGPVLSGMYKCGLRSLCRHVLVKVVILAIRRVWKPIFAVLWLRRCCPPRQFFPCISIMLWTRTLCFQNLPVWKGDVCSMSSSLFVTTDSLETL